MLDSIEADVVYNHEKYGDVLVTGVARMYEEYTVSEGSEETVSSAEGREVLVFFNHRYDGYGGMDAMPSTQPVMEFAKSAERVRKFDYGSDLCEGRVDDDGMCGPSVSPDEFIESLPDDGENSGE